MDWLSGQKHENPGAGVDRSQRVVGIPIKGAKGAKRSWACVSSINASLSRLPRVRTGGQEERPSFGSLLQKVMAVCGQWAYMSTNVSCSGADDEKTVVVGSLFFNGGM